MNPAETMPTLPPAGYDALAQQGAEAMAGHNAEFMQHRVEQALEVSPFKKTPELAENIEGFYDLHYQLDGVIADTLESGVPQDETEKFTKTEELQNIIESSYLPSDKIKEVADNLLMHGNLPHPPYAQLTMPVLASIRLARFNNPDDKHLERAELMALASANKSLFAEASVAVTTVSEEDKARIVQNDQAIKAKMESSGLFGPHGAIMDLPRAKFNMSANPLYEVETAQKTFWKDTRFAGQMLFHNTNKINEVMTTGALQPRRVQVAAKGSFNTQNREYDGDKYHSPTPHWSENFDYGTLREGKHGGTIGVPLAEIIKTAPYARDSEYGVLSLKDEEVQTAIPHITVHDGTAAFGAGASDAQGAGGVDRTFYKSGSDVPADAPLENAPDGYQIPINENTTWVQLGDEVAKSGLLYGTGEHFPDIVKIDIPTQPGGSVFKSDRAQSIEEIDAQITEREAVTTAAIRELQHRSIAKYGTDIVVPLRSNVMDFYVPDDGASKHKPEAEFTRIAIAA